MKKNYRRILPFLAFFLAFTMLSINLPVRSIAEETVQTTAAEDDRIPAETMPNPDADDGNDSEPSSDPTIEIGEISNSDTAELMGPPVITPTPDPTPETQITSGVYKLVNYGNSKVVDTESGGTTAGTRVQQWSNYGTTFNINQLFKITYLSTVNYVNYYSIRPMTNSGLGLCTSSVTNGNVTLEEMSTTESYSQIPTEMKWVISVYSSTAGTYTIRCVYSSTSSGYLSTGGSTTNGAQLVTEAYSSTANYQKWQLVPYTGDVLEGVGWNHFSPILFSNDTFTYQAYMYSSVIGRNGPISYSIRNGTDDVEEYASITSTTGELYAANEGIIQIGISHPALSSTQWYDIEIFRSLGTCYLQSKVSRKCIQLDTDNTTLIQYDFNINNDQAWDIAQNSDSYYFIRKNGTLKYLTTPTELMDDIPVTLEDFNSSIIDRQLWSITLTSTGTCKLQAKIRENTSLVLALGDGTVTSNGVNIEQRVSGYVSQRDEWYLLGKSKTILGVPTNLSSGGSHLCIPCAITNVAGYWSWNGYSGFNCRTASQQEIMASQVQEAMIQGGGSCTTNAYIPYGFAIFEHTEGSTTYILSSANYWKRDNAFTILDIIEEINRGNPILLGFAAGGYYSEGHMTVCAGYFINGSDFYISVSDAHYNSYQDILFDSTYNDFICKVAVVSN